VNGFQSGLLHGDQCNYERSNVWKKVMGEKTGFEVRNLISRLFTNGFQSDLMPSDQCSYHLTKYNIKTGVSDSTGNSVFLRE
jgi:hypothetical protein